METRRVSEDKFGSSSLTRRVSQKRSVYAGYVVPCLARTRAHNVIATPYLFGAVPRA